jgi:hypothetical protein
VEKSRIQETQKLIKHRSRQCCSQKEKEKLPRKCQSFLISFVGGAKKMPVAG